MSDAGRHFTEGGEIFLKLDLVLEFNDFGKVR